MNDCSKSKEELISEIAELKAKLNQLEQGIHKTEHTTFPESNTHEILEREMQERQRAENALASERDLLRTLIDSIPDNIYVKDDQFRYVIDNRAHTQFLGSDNPESVIGKTVYDFFPKKLADQYHQDDLSIVNSGTPLINREEPIVERNGQRRWISTTKIPVRDSSGKIIRLVCISRDITELREAQIALQEERNLLRTLIDHMPDFIFVKDLQSRFIITNQTHVRELGAKKPEEILGKTDFDFFPKELAQVYFSDEKEIFETGKSLIGKEEPTLDINKNQRWLSTTKVPLKDAHGKITSIVGISRDITERKKFETALQKSKDELEIRVAERTADLKMANEHLEGRLSQLNFLTATSYELAQYIHLDELCPAILKSFSARLPRSALSLCKRTKEGFKCVSALNELDSQNGTFSSERALEVFHRTELPRTFFIEDWHRDEQMVSFTWPKELEKYPCYIAIPLLADNRTISIVQIFTTDEYFQNYEQERAVLETLSAHAAICLSNAVHYQELGEKARLQGELDAARSIQRSFTPHYKPNIPHVELKGVYSPAFEVGGDYLDYFQTESGNWVVVIADVCGKGIPAALLMTVLRSIFRVESRTHTTAKTLLCAVNESMKINLDDKSFVTALCLVISKDGKSMTYSRAGHPMLLRQRDEGKVEVIPCSGIALGLVSDASTFSAMVDEVTLPLDINNRYLIYTDGLTEATDPDKNSYGIQRLTSLLEKNKDESPNELIESILMDIKEFTRGAPYHDDLTILAMKVVE